MGLSENKIMILEVLAISGPRSRDTIARYTKIPRTTVYDNLITLLLRGYVSSYHKKTDKHNSGRPKTIWRINL